MLDDYIGPQGQSAPTRHTEIKPGHRVSIVAGPYPQNIGKVLEVKRGAEPLLWATPIDKANTLFGHDSDGFGTINIGPGEIVKIDPLHVVVV